MDQRQSSSVGAAGTTSVMSSASESTSAAPAPAAMTKKRGSACTRCRSQKIRCDNTTPACVNCVRAGAECIKSDAKQYVAQLEQRVRSLEDLLENLHPGIIDKSTGELVLPPPQSANVASPHLGSASESLRQGTAPTLASPAGSTATEIGPHQPLAHDLGLLSLGNSSEPKYLGPSSGVTFAQLIFATAHQTQGLSSQVLNDDATALSHVHQNEYQSFENALPADLPTSTELNQFVDTYFDVWHPLYPFLSQMDFQSLLQKVYGQKYEQHRSHQNLQSSLCDNMDHAQLFLVLSLGAKALESRLSTDFSSERYYSTAMHHIAKIRLHDSIRGIQTLLLLVLCGFSFNFGLNTWFLTSTIIASCIDLGLQRKRPSHWYTDTTSVALRAENVRCGVFWSAYSLDRTLSVVLGRPLTLRDEAIDIPFPNALESDEIDHGALYSLSTQSGDTGQDPSPQVHRSKKQRTMSYSAPVWRIPSSYSHSPATHSFRFDRITAEIKLMIYRVAQSPNRFPWPHDIAGWQADTHRSCTTLMQTAQEDLSTRRDRCADRNLSLIMLKYHQCLMLLYRPSPLIPEPTFEALKTCYDSAVETLCIYHEMDRFASLTKSWFTAHTIFVSGMTMLYCFWKSVQTRRSVQHQVFRLHTGYCSKLLGNLGKSWSVAEDARTKYDRLVQLTMDNWNQEIVAASAEGIDLAAIPMSASNTVGQQSMHGQNATDLFNNLDCMPWPDVMLEELGDMSSWFDLEWLAEADVLRS